MKMIPMPEDNDKVILEGGLFTRVYIQDSEEFDPPIYDFREADWQIDVLSSPDGDIDTINVKWNENLQSWEQVSYDT